MESTLKTIKLKLIDIQRRLIWESKTVNIPAQGNFVQFSNLTILRSALSDLHALGLFNKETDSLVESVIFTTGRDSLQLQQAEGNVVNNSLAKVKTLADSFLDVLVKTIPDEDPSSINIKLPPVNDFEELSKVSKDIHVALSQVIFNKEIGGQTKIVSVENGSIWLNVFIGTTAVSLVASLVWSAAVIYKKIQEGRLLEQQIRGLKVKNDSMEDILKAQKAETEAVIQAEAEFISSEYFKENLPENIGKIKNSITIFAELITKGAEIHPALVAPEEVSNLFPEPSKFLGLESKIKKLGPSSEN
ncbi:MAG: hypothetical protein NTY88_05425 [Bacteroidetes bacterium]|nr:hypothetical protein [Bacteroidota bacterium]